MRLLVQHEFLFLICEFIDTRSLTKYRHKLYFGLIEWVTFVSNTNSAWNFAKKKKNLDYLITVNKESFLFFFPSVHCRRTLVEVMAKAAGKTKPSLSLIAILNMPTESTFTCWLLLPNKDKHLLPHTPFSFHFQYLFSLRCPFLETKMSIYLIINNDTVHGLGLTQHTNSDLMFPYYLWCYQHSFSVQSWS